MLRVRANIQFRGATGWKYCIALYESVRRVDRVHFLRQAGATRGRRLLLENRTVVWLGGVTLSAAVYVVGLR